MSNLSSVFLQDVNVFARETTSARSKIEEKGIAPKQNLSGSEISGALDDITTVSTTGDNDQGIKLSLGEKQNTAPKSDHNSGMLARLQQLEIENRMLRFEAARYDPLPATNTAMKYLTPVTEKTTETNDSHAIIETKSVSTSTSTLEVAPEKPIVVTHPDAYKINELEHLTAQQSVEIESLLRQNYILKQEGRRLLSLSETLQTKVIDLNTNQQSNLHTSHDSTSRTRYVTKLSEFMVETISIPPLIPPDTAETSTDRPESRKSENAIDYGSRLREIRSHLKDNYSANATMPGLYNIIGSLEANMTISNFSLDQACATLLQLVESPKQYHHVDITRAATSTAETQTELLTKSVSITAIPIQQDDSTQTLPSYEYNELLLKLETLQKENDSMQQHVHNLEKTIHGWKAECESLQNAIFTLKKAKDATRQKYEKEAERWKAKFDEEHLNHRKTKVLLQSIKSGISQNGNIQTDQALANNNIPAVTMSFMNDFDHILQLLQTNAALQDKLRDAVTQVKRLQDELQKLTMESGQLKSTITEQERAFSTTISDHNQQKVSYESQIAQLNSSITDKEKLLQQYQTQFTNSLFLCQALPSIIQSRLRQHDQHPLDFEGIISPISAAFNDAKEEIGMANSKIADLEREKIRLVSRIEKLETDYQSQCRERDSLQVTLRNSESKLSEVTGKLQEEERNKQTLERKMKKIIEAGLMMVGGGRNNIAGPHIPEKRAVSRDIKVSVFQHNFLL
jgi:predicted  nucleic acid-binding Zn-ribbon protein